MAIRLTLLRQHYRSDWEWTDGLLWDAVDTLDAWRLAVATGAGAPAGPVVETVLAALADDLDAPRAVAAIEEWAAATREGATEDPDAGATIRTLADAALGLRL
jgi:L-cysteine:1D-myo-inositol 2-amino-2-deoxy-alpha-D-glucopyranoside ligase